MEEQWWAECFEMDLEVVGPFDTERDAWNWLAYTDCNSELGLYHEWGVYSYCPHGVFTPEEYEEA